MKKIITTCLVAIAPLTFNYGQELLTNPGFDSAGAGWGSFGNASFNDFFGGNEHASFFADTPGNSGGVFQTGIAATAGNEYTFNLTDFFVEDNFGGDISVALEFYEGDDTTFISDETTLVSLVIADPEPADGSLTVTSTAPAGAAFVRPLIRFDNVDGSAASNENFFVFQSSLTAVPEPAMGSLLLGVAALAAVSLRRRRNS
jgi:hypothetical protein